MYKIQVCGPMNPPIVNKTNVLMATMMLLGALSDPQFTAILPAVYASKILFFGGLLGGIIRIFFTGPYPVQPDDPNKPAG